MIKMKAVISVSLLASSVYASCSILRCSEGWTTVHDFGSLDECSAPMMIVPDDYVDAVNGTSYVCSLEATLRNVVMFRPVPMFHPVPRNTTLIKRGGTDECTTGSELAGLTFDLRWWGGPDTGYRSTISAAKATFVNYYNTNCQELTGFVRSGSVSIGAFNGQMVQNSGTSTNLISPFFDNIASEGCPNGKLLQYCGNDPAKTAGITVDTQNNFAAVQSTVRNWSKGQCIGGGDGNWPRTNQKLKFVKWPGKSGNRNPDPNIGTCDWIRVQSGDNAGSLAARCGSTMTGDGIQINNPTVNFFNLVVGQPICCSLGNLPDLRPPMKSDGSCVYHTIAEGETCAVLMATYYPLSQANLMDYNKNTYGWYGCGYEGHPWPGDKICVSNGTPPKPTPNAESECGPLAPGGKYNSECPLKACCSYAGFCGLDSEHCAIKKSPTGAPGTTGCFSNCDLKFVSSSPPSQFINVGYYESWSIGWKCMNGGFEAVDWSKYTHVHYAFADIDSNLMISMDRYATLEFNAFKQLVGPKKILSIGGWGISTDVGSYTHLRNAMIPANVDITVGNLVKFIVGNSLDGIDIDWEYPGAPDIPGIPPGLASDGPNYLTFLKKLRAALPSDKSLSIAAPASYWYLKAFPIVEMSKYLDYIVYMTYDLHGQWDYGNRWTGNYLRSHVNWTETMDTLALITHAGVPSNKLLLGMGAYGRSFQQTDPSCSGPMCTFTGPNSGATPGQCTNTAGYISLTEINNIIESGKYRRKYYDSFSDNDFLLYGADQWVAWTTEATMGGRRNWAKNNNLGGTVVWAADLSSNDMDTGDVDDGILIGVEYWDINALLCIGDYSGTLDNIANKGICQDESLAKAISGSIKESSKEISQVINNLPDLSIVEQNSNLQWIIENYKKYFTCTTGACHNKATLDWKNSNVQGFYEAYTSSTGIPWYMIVNGTVDTTPPQCTDIRPVSINSTSSKLEKRICSGASTIIYDFPVYSSASGTEFNSLFNDWYRPNVHKTMLDSFYAWMYGKGFVFQGGECSQKKPGAANGEYKIGKYLEVTTQGDVRSVDPALYDDFIKETGSTLNKSDFELGSAKFSICNIQQITTSIGTIAYSYQIVDLTYNNFPKIKIDVISNPLHVYGPSDLDDIAQLINYNVNNYNDTIMDIIIGAKYIASTTDIAIQSIKEIIQYSLQMKHNNAVQQNAKLDVIGEIVVMTLLSFIPNEGAQLVMSLVQLVTGIIGSDILEIGMAMLGVAMSAASSIISSAKASRLFARTIDDVAKLESKIGKELDAHMPKKKIIEKNINDLPQHYCGA